MTREEKQKAIDALKISAPIMAVTQEEFKDYIRTLNRVMDWLEHEPTTKNDLGVDAISRKQAIEEADKLCLETGYDNEKVIEMLNELPTVTPQPKTGHWILDETDNSITCDKCGCLIWANDISNGEVYFCPNCGSRNRGRRE